MTGKIDTVSVPNLPSHLSQPSRRAKKPDKVSTNFVPIAANRQRRFFAPNNCDFRAESEEDKKNFQHHRTSSPLSAALPPEGRFVASKDESGVWIPPGPFWSVLGRFSARREQSRRKGWGRARPHPGRFCPQCGQLRKVCHRGRRTTFSAGGGVKNRKSPAVAGKTAGSQLYFREEDANDK